MWLLENKQIFKSWRAEDWLAKGDDNSDGDVTDDDGMVMTELTMARQAHFILQLLYQIDTFRFHCSHFTDEEQRSKLNAKPASGYG